MRRALSTALFVAQGALVVAPARADPKRPTKEECVDAYKKNQPLRRDGRYREAIEQLLVCARDPCPAVLQSDCINWLREARTLVPSIVVRPHAAADADVTNVRVTMDGVEITTRLDGRALDVDVGVHTFVFERAGSAPIEKKILIVQGEQNRIVDVELGPAPSASASSSAVAAPAASHSPTGAQSAGVEPSTRPIPWTVYALGGAAVVALGTSGVFGAMGLAARQDLYRCKDAGCPDADVDAVARKFRIADIALATSVVLGGAAIVFYATRPTVAPSAALFVQPTAGGLAVGAARRF